MAPKVYTASDIRKIVNWVKGPQLEKVLRDAGIAPASEIRMSARVYRTYSAESIRKAKVLREERMARKAEAEAEAKVETTPARKQGWELAPNLVADISDLRERLVRTAMELQLMRQEQLRLIEALTQPRDRMPEFDDEHVALTQ